MNTAERNLKAKNYVLEKIEEARRASAKDFSGFSKDAELNGILKDLIHTKANGFRGIVLTAIVGMFLNKNYDPLTNFYECNPRSIFEQGIWYALHESGIPSGKSDPLNVAKNINVLDERWAKGKRPESAALAVVLFLRRLASAKKSGQYERLVKFFFYQLDVYAKSVSSIKIEGISDPTALAQNISDKLIRFMLKFPESGTTPQFIIGKLLEQVFLGGPGTVKGTQESVFGTNTTSKKPADIWIEEDGNLINLYEVTVKKIDGKRLDDCLDSLSAMNILDKPVTFICRVPIDSEDIFPKGEGVGNYKGKDFYILDICNFIKVTLGLLTQKKIGAFMDEMVDHVQNINRPVATKKGWSEIFSEA